MMIRRSQIKIAKLPEGVTSQNVEILVGDHCFMERCGDKLQGYWYLPNASFSSSDETLLKMPTDWVVPHVYRSYQIVQWRHEPLRVWYQEGPQGIYRVEEQVLEEESLVQAQKGEQAQRGLRPQAQKEAQAQPQRGRRPQRGRQQVATMTRNVTIPLTVPK